MTQRTVLHGTCLLNGKHKPGDPYAGECPLNPERKQRLSERAQKAAKARWTGQQGSRKHQLDAEGTDALNDGSK